MGSPEGRCRSKSLCPSHAAGPECCAEGGDSRFLCVHRRYRPGDYETWKYVAPIQKAAWSHKTFEYGTWGGEIRSEFDLNRATSWPSSIGAPVALPIPIWICS